MNKNTLTFARVTAASTFQIVVTTARYRMPMILPVGTTPAEAKAAHMAQLGLAGEGDRVELVADGESIIDCQL